MNDKPLVSVIIVNFNGKKYLRRCFESLLAGTYKNIEIIFVDNGSSDASIEFVRENFPHVTVIDNQSNLGLSIASNRGAQAAKGAYLFFYNNDTIADERLIEKLTRKLQEEPATGICGCRTLTYDGKTVINEGVHCDIFGYPYGKGEIFYVDAAIFIRRDLFERLGGFDEKMFLYGEDRDICWRCWLYGYAVKVVPEAVFYHDSACISEDLRAYITSLNKRFLGEYNAMRSLLKNYSLPFLVAIMPLYIAINIAEAFAFIVSGQPEVFGKAYLKAYAQLLRDLADIREKRRIIQRERKISDFELLRHMMKISGKLRLLFKMGIPHFGKDIKYTGN